MRYVVDIDGTICTFTDGKYENASPIEDRINQINELYEKGHTVVYFTARGMHRTSNDPKLVEILFRELTERQLREWGCKYHYLIMGKPSADVYIDDKGIHSDDFFK
jgi:hypothetical protein